MTQFNIEIVSDTICPWCYVGKKKLEQAIAEYQTRHPGSSDTFSTTWKAFYLNPTAPKTGVDKVSHYNEKFGPDNAAMMLNRISKVGNDVGIKFDFAGKTGRTQNSHRLIHLAKSTSPEVQTRVVSNLMRGYFEEAQDITSVDFLTKAGVDAGLDEKKVRALFAGDEVTQQVDAEAQEARESEISGVPNFTVNGRYEIGGAQDPAVFLRLFELIKAADK